MLQKEDGQLSHRLVEEEMTSTYDDLGLRYERDAFDTLFDHAPDKLQVVKKVRHIAPRSVCLWSPVIEGDNMRCMSTKHQ